MVFSTMLIKVFFVVFAAAEQGAKGSSACATTDSCATTDDSSTRMSEHLESPDPGQSLLQVQSHRRDSAATPEAGGGTEATEALATEALASTHSEPRQPADGSLKGTFDRIADSNVWGSNETVSGEGSNMDMTAGVRNCLGQWLQKYEAKVFVDVPCGDANWQAGIPGIHEIVYKGYDIADTAIQTARAKNLHHQAMSFDQLDLTAQVPPIKADIILVRDVIQHLPLEKGKQMLLNAKKSGAKFLAVTSFSDGVNENINAGSFYKNNVHSSPFNLPAAVESCKNYDDGKVLPSDSLELIDLSTWKDLE